MLDPTKCSIVRKPLIINGKVVWEATMTFHVKEEIAAELVNLRDFARMEALDNQVREKLHRLVWKAVYGDVIAPVMQLVVAAKRFAPPNYQTAVVRNCALCVQLLKIKLDSPKGAGGHVASAPDDPPAPHLPDPDPSENRP